jgi:LmbE family N-acetylglucosaminyl deacetylase
MQDKVLVVAPHPDDETLGCGGTLLRYKDIGDEIYWLIVTNIHTENGWDGDKVKKRQEEIQKVADIYGFDKTFKLDFPTTMLDTISYNDLIAKMSVVIQEVKPSIVYLPNRSDIHTDHQVTFRSGISCCKNFRVPSIKRILMYECLSETEFAPAYGDSVFIPNGFVDITPFFDKKIEIMKIYDSEIGNSPFPRSLEIIECLAKIRGSRIGKKYAEAFSILLDIT